MQRLRAHLRELSVSDPHVLVACSGGRDSVALVALIAELVRLGCLRATVAHVNHQQEVHADHAMRSVQAIGETLGLKVVTETLPADVINRHPGVGSEEALRRARYQALARMTNGVGADLVSTAHHRRDQAETVLLHMMRGSGLAGLSGMKSYSTLTVPWWESDAEVHEMHIWRPLLNESPDSLAAIVVDTGLPVVEDPSNAETDYRRNVIRHEVLPLLDRIAPGAEQAIARTAGVLADENTALEHATRLLLTFLQDNGGLSRMKLVSYPNELSARIVRTWLTGAGIWENVSSERIQAIVAMAHVNRGGARIELPGGTSVVLQGGELRVVPPCDNTNSRGE